MTLVTDSLSVSRLGDRMAAIGRGLSGRIAAVSLAVLAMVAGAATYAWLAGFAPASLGTTGWMTGLLVADLVVAIALVAVLAVRLTQLWLDRRRGAAGSQPPRAAAGSRVDRPGTRSHRCSRAERRARAHRPRP